MLMNEKKLFEIIEKLRTNQREWKTVDAKQDLMLKENGNKAEFVKDIAAMANNFETSYLVIGLKDKTFSDVGVLVNHYTKNDINQLLEGKIDPPVIIDYQEFSIGLNEYALIEIFGSNPPYIIAQDITHLPQDQKKARIYKGTIFVRHEDRTEGISRSELEVLVTKGLRREFENETEAAKKIAFERPKYWEYLLTAELLKTRIQSIKREFYELDRGVLFRRSKRLSGMEFVKWVMTSMKDLLSLTQALSNVINDDFRLVAWGKPGEPGDASLIKQASDRVYSLCRELLEWEIENRSILPPDAFASVKKMIEGWAKEIILSVDRIPSELLKPFENPNPSGQHVIEINVAPMLNSDEVTAEIQRLLTHQELWNE
jgi:hypothetical protein